MRKETRTNYEELLLRVINHVHEHLDEDLSLGRLARIACLSPYHFHRVFTGLMGETALEYVRRIRLERATQKLLQDRDAIAEIALGAGYKTHESFTRAFKARFGLSPSDFRKLLPADMPETVIAAGITLLNIGGSKMDVRIEQVPDKIIAYMRHVGPYHEIVNTWTKMNEWCHVRQEVLTPHVWFLSVFHDDPGVTSESELRSDACITLDAPIEPEGEVQIGELKGGEYAVVTYVGHYSGLGAAWHRAFTEVLPATGRKPGQAPECTSPCYEVYRTNPEVTPPDEWVTEIYIPLQPES